LASLLSGCGESSTSSRSRDGGTADASSSGAGSSSANGGSSNGRAGGTSANGSGGTSTRGSGGTSTSGSAGSGHSGGRSGTGGAAGSNGAAGRTSDAGGGGTTGENTGLRVQGNRILTPDGKPFHGRGANLHDMRSCNACTSLDPDVAGLNRWSDELFDNWGANFVRFDLEAYADDGGYRKQWKRITDDATYAADVKTAVSHITQKNGVYALVTLFADPSMKPDNGDYDSEWPTADTIPAYQKIAELFADDPKVLFGLTNEPHGPAANDAELTQRYLDSIDAIRATESANHSPEHIIVVQAPQQWARYLDYYVQNPIQRTQIAYEVHVYNPQSDFDALLTQPAKTLPILVGEYGPSPYMSDGDIQAFWTLVKQLEIPHIAWNFHMRCPPDMLQDTASDGCGLSASTGYDFPRTSWGDSFHAYLATPW
jgi:hypothetical protein